MSCAHWLTNKPWGVYCGAGSAEPRFLCESCRSKALKILVRNKNKKRRSKKKIADCVRFSAASSFTQKHLTASLIPWTSGHRFKRSNQFCVWVKFLKGHTGLKLLKENGVRVIHKNSISNTANSFSFFFSTHLFSCKGPTTNCSPQSELQTHCTVSKQTLP